MRFKSALKKFAYETFRPHSKEEYKELFARGNGEERVAVYPWFYARVLLFSLLLFTLLCVGYSLSELNFILVAFAGGIFADLTFIVLLFEIYPKRDMSLLTIIAALVIGGFLSSVFIYILYGVANYNAPFADQAWTAFVEETGKALATVIILLILKKRNPFFCFIIGAAVGGGFSAFENMWYMYTHGFYWYGLSEAMETGLWRALGTPFSHAAWAGAFGWAISFDKPWRKWQPYAIYAFNYTMHFLVNFPLMDQFAGWKGYPISAITGILSIILIIFLITKCRRDLAANTVESIESNLSAAGAYPRINDLYAVYYGGNYSVSRLKFIANILAAAAILCFSFTLLGPTCVYGGTEGVTEYYYDDLQTCIDIAQSGLTFTPDFNREYVEYEDLSQNFAYTWADGELVSVTQREQYGDYFYRFIYGYVTYVGLIADADGNYHIIVNGQDTIVEVELDEEGNPPEELRIWQLTGVYLEYEDRLVAANSAWQYDKDIADDGNRVRYFAVNPNVYAIYWENVKGGRYVLGMREQSQIRLVESIVFTSIFGAAFIGCGVAYIVYKRKIRRYENAERQLSFLQDN